MKTSKVGPKSDGRKEEARLVASLERDLQELRYKM
jgi:hypothetical protein